MTSRFTRLFKKTDPDEMRAFQGRVLSILREIQPDRPFKTADDALVLTLNGQVLGLTNIRSNFLLGSQTDSELRELIAEHFARVVTDPAGSSRTEISWADASPLLRPQLMPEAYLEKLRLVSRPFGGGIVLGFVIDDDEIYSYVTNEDKERWAVSDDEIQETAVENLKAASRGIELTLFPSPNAYAAISTLDGYDAARIMIPGIRKVLAEDLGDLFYFAVPNRDFLICWSADCDRDFANGMRSQISQDFGERPYPLSPSVFKVTADGEFVEVEAEPVKIGQPEFN